MENQQRRRFRRLTWLEGQGWARLTIALLTIAVIVGATSAVASRLHPWHRWGSDVSGRDSLIPASPNPSEIGKSIAQGPPQAKLTESVLLTITPRGFDLKEITVPAVPFFLLVENRSGLSEMSLSLQRETGNLVRAARVQREDLDWAELLDLTPGRYVITEASHPEQVCRLMVTPR